MAQTANWADVAVLFQAIIAANAQAAAAPPPIIVPPPPPAPYALLPGDAFNVVLDYTKTADMKIFRASTNGMDEKFDLKEEHLRVFLETVKEHVRTYNWNDVVTVPDGAAVNRNLVINYGQLTFEHIIAHVNTYINIEGRTAQNSILMYKYLLDSLTDDAKLIMVTLSDQFHIADRPIGSLFLKLVVGRASIDNRVKILLLRESVSHLYMKMLEQKGNVRLFNEHVSDLVSALSGRGHTVDALVMHLFKAYEQVQDAQFCRYVNSIRDRYDSDLEDVTFGS
jgi:hypothetical protein